MSNITQKIEEFNKDRDKALFDLKCEKMKETVFGFFRGTSHLFYENLLKDPPADPTKIWICGDLHLQNFGAYKGADGITEYDIEDFDDTVIAPVTWEILRMMTSIYLAVAGFPKLLGKADLAEDLADELVETFFETYQRVILAGKTFDLKNETIAMFIEKKTADRKDDRLRKLTNVFEEGDKQLIDITKHDPTKEPKIMNMGHVLKGQLKPEVKAWLKANNLHSFDVLDVAHRITGTGSLGVDRYIFLLEDTSKTSPVERFFLIDMKESAPSGARKSALETNIAQPEWDSEAQRILGIQGGMQKLPPLFLEKLPPFSREMIFNGKRFIIKEIQGESERIEFVDFEEKPKKLREIVVGYAEIAAQAHLRLAGTPGTSDREELKSFFRKSELSESTFKKKAKSYFNQVKEDFEKFKTGQ